MFGEGRHPDFRTLLDTKISPFLSSSAYQFWRDNETAFQSSFYFRGYSGWALRLAKWAFKISGIEADVKRFCEAKNIEEQRKIWNEKMRPVLLNQRFVKMFMANP